MASDFTAYKDPVEAAEWICSVMSASASLDGLASMELECLAAAVTVRHQRRSTTMSTKTTGSEAKGKKLEPWVGILCDGSISCNGEGTHMRLMELAVGDVVGVTGLVMNEPDFMDLKTPGGRGCTLLTLTYRELHAINQNQPDLGLKLYQTFGRAAYHALEGTLRRISGQEEFTDNTSVVSRAMLKELLQTWFVDKKLLGSAYEVTHEDLQNLYDSCKLLTPWPGDLILKRGKRADHILIVLKGEVTAVAEAAGSHVVRTYTAGQPIGETEFIRSFNKSKSAGGGYAAVRPHNIHAYKPRRVEETEEEMGSISKGGHACILIALPNRWLLNLHEENAEMTLAVYRYLVMSAHRSLLRTNEVDRLVAERDKWQAAYERDLVSDEPDMTKDAVMSASGLQQSKEDRADLVKHVLGGKCWKFIPRGDTKILGRMMKMMMFKSGAVLARIDDPSRWFALVVNGTVAEEYSDGNTVLYREGDMLGHTGMFWTGTKRVGTWTVEEDCVLAVVSYRELFSIYRSSPESGTRLLRALVYATVELLKTVGGDDDESERIGKGTMLLGDHELDLQMPEDLVRALADTPLEAEMRRTLELMDNLAGNGLLGKLCEQWSEDERAHFASVARLLAVQQGGPVLKAGHRGVVVMFVLDGDLMRRLDHAQSPALKMYKPGACVGGSALLNRGKDEIAVLRDGNVYVSSSPGMVGCTITMEQLYVINHTYPNMGQQLFFRAIRAEVGRLKQQMEDIVSGKRWKPVCDRVRDPGRRRSSMDSMCSLSRVPRPKGRSSTTSVKTDNATLLDWDNKKPFASSVTPSDDKVLDDTLRFDQTISDTQPTGVSQVLRAVRRRSVGDLPHLQSPRADQDTFTRAAADEDESRNQLATPTPWDVREGLAVDEFTGQEQSSQPAPSKLAPSNRMSNIRALSAAPVESSSPHRRSITRDPVQSPVEGHEESIVPCHMEQPHKGLSQAGLVHAKVETDLKMKMKIQNLGANIEIQHNNNKPVVNRVPRHLQRHVMSRGQIGTRMTGQTVLAPVHSPSTGSEHRRLIDESSSIEGAGLPRLQRSSSGSMSPWCLAAGRARRVSLESTPGTVPRAPSPSRAAHRHAAGLRPSHTKKNAPCTVLNFQCELGFLSNQCPPPAIEGEGVTLLCKCATIALHGFQGHEADLDLADQTLVLRQTSSAPMITCSPEETCESMADSQLHNTAVSLYPPGPPIELFGPKAFSQPVLTTLPMRSTVMPAHSSQQNLSSFDEPNLEFGFLTPETSVIDVGLGSANPNPLPQSPSKQSLLPVRPPTDPNSTRRQARESQYHPFAATRMNITRPITIGATVRHKISTEKKDMRTNQKQAAWDMTPCNTFPPVVPQVSFSPPSPGRNNGLQKTSSVRVIRPITEQARQNAQQLYSTHEALEPSAFVTMSSRQRNVQTSSIVSRPYIHRPSVVSNINIGSWFGIEGVAAQPIVSSAGKRRSTYNEDLPN